MKRIGILGGSFNPVHVGHLMMAQYAMEGKGLDQVIFMPTFVTPLKSPRDLAPALERYAMVKAAVKGLPYFSVSDFEVRAKKSSYTFETLNELRKVFKDDKIYWIIGEDLLKDLPRWKNIEGIGKLASFIVLNRPKVKVKFPKVPVKCHSVAMPPIGVSSSEIRSRLKQGKSIDFMTPAIVTKYIKAHKLYT